MKLALIILAMHIFFTPKNLTWDPPTTNIDGSPLTNLAGYKMYCNSAPKQKGFGQDIGWGDTKIPNDPHPKYKKWVWPGDKNWCTVTAYNTLGRESEKSNEIEVSY